MASRIAPDGSIYVFDIGITRFCWCLARDSCGSGTTVFVAICFLTYTPQDFLDGLSDVNDHTEVIYKLEVFGAHVQEISRDDDL